jgi:hypothetical protein
VQEFRHNICALTAGADNTSPSVRRVEHGYGNTRGVSETGTAGTGTVVDFDTPQYTATRTRGVAGIHGLNICLR